MDEIHVLSGTDATQEGDGSLVVGGAAIVVVGSHVARRDVLAADGWMDMIDDDQLWVDGGGVVHRSALIHSLDIFKKEFGARVWDREKLVVIPDHYIFTSDDRANRNVDILRDFCAEQNVKYFYDIKDLRQRFRSYKGVCHCRPGEVLLGTDSHTCNAGAFGQFATGIGNTDAYKLCYICSFLRIYHIIGEISVSGATYKSMEFVGSTVESLTMEERMTLCNMVIEAGGKNGVVPADETTFKYLEGKTSVDYEPVYSDAQARFFSDYRFDVSKLEPVVAKGKKVKVPTFLVPATQKVWLDVYSLPVPGSGGKTCSQVFEEAGCDTPASPNCGACLGGPRDTYARMNEPTAFRCCY
ncbi:3-isopropylmalate dehydratase large subunit [Zea mays]|uniref:3-isopropylmalate dehydratase large subunit n=1 Tax=Zea mays TaxID=4577 RepID=A0A1D6QTU4_MAIZE|nr:3-isopropylmalate dehydratase large subunit [Zea mays]